MLLRRLPKGTTSQWKGALFSKSNSNANYPRNIDPSLTAATTTQSTRWSSTSVFNNSNNSNNNNNKKWLSHTQDIRFNSTSATTTSNKRNKKQELNFQTLTPPSSTSPWFNQLCAFDDNVNQSLMDKDFRTPGFNRGRGEYKKNGNSQNLALFWDSITRAIHIYSELVGVCPEMDATRVSALVNLIHNGLRINRFQLVKLNKKPDYDSKSFHHEMINYLTTTLHSITEDILNHKVTINEYGLMHLLTSLKELNLTTEIVQLWDLSKKDEELQALLKQPKCLGVLLPILYEKGTKYTDSRKDEYSFKTLKALYEDGASKLNYIHPNLICGMIKTSLAANEPRYALELFDKLSKLAEQPHIPNKGALFNYLTEAHLSFIGDSRDINVAETFWKNALHNEMPYRVVLQVSYINLFLTNIWNETKDFNRVVDVWLTMIAQYTRLNLNIGVFSSLNNNFMDLFFNGKYANNKMEGFQELDRILTQYQQKRPIDEPLLNIILTKSSEAWNDKEIYDHVRNSYQLYDIPETVITKRILLKTLGSITDDVVTTKDIWNQWIELLTKIDAMGQRYIANADWAAIRDATLSKNRQNANDPTTKERAELYVKIVKLFNPYCRDPVQRDRISRVASTHNTVLKTYWEAGKFDTIETSGLEMPKLPSLQQ